MRAMRMVMVMEEMMMTKTYQENKYRVLREYTGT